MPITGLPSFADGEVPSAAKLNAFRTALVNKFGGSITGADLKYPFQLGGNLDLNGHNILEIQAGLGDIRFADDFQTLQEAIEDLPSSGGIVYLSGTTYVQEDVLQLHGTSADKDNVVLIGAGYSTKIQASSDFTASRLIDISDGENMQISNLCLDLNSKAINGFWGLNASYPRVQGCWFVNGGGQQYVFLSAPTGGRITGTYFSSGSTHIYLTGTASECTIRGNRFISPSTAIYFSNPRNSVISENFIYGSTSQSINVSVSTAGLRTPVHIQNNLIHNSSGSNIYVSPSADFTGCSISGNILSGGTNGVEIALSASNKIRNIKITNNAIITHTAEAIDIAGGRAEVLMISNNVIYESGTGAYHIKVDGNGNANDVTGGMITGNNIESIPTGPTTFQEGGLIDLQNASDVSNFLIIGNVGNMDQALHVRADAQYGHVLDNNMFYQPVLP